MKITVVYENKDFLVIDKPAGLIVHSAVSATDTVSLVDFLLKKYPTIKNVGDNPSLRPGIVHRLDRDTSGLLIIAKNQKSFELIKQIFKDRKIKKTYLALVCGEIKQKNGALKTYIGRSNKDPRKRISLPSPKKGLKTRVAITEYQLINVFEDINNNRYSLLKIRIKTGRTHQIRSQFFSINYPVVGDPIYKIKKQSGLTVQRMFLHAEKLAFTFNNEYYQFYSPLPSSLKKILNNLKHVKNISR